MRALGPLDPSTLPESELARVGLQTVHAMVNAVWPALLAALSFLLILTNPSDSLFGDVLGALQALPSTVGCLALLSMPHDVFRSGSPGQICRPATGKNEPQGLRSTTVAGRQASTTASTITTGSAGASSNVGHVVSFDARVLARWGEGGWA